MEYLKGVLLELICVVFILGRKEAEEYPCQHILLPLGFGVEDSKLCKGILRP